MIKRQEAKKQERQQKLRLLNGITNLTVMEIATKCAETALQYRVRFGCSGVLLKTEYLIMEVVGRESV